MTTFATRIAKELSLSAAKVEAVIALLDDSATIPFIARYRKEVTGGMDEVAIAAIRDRNEQLGELEKRRSAITQSLDERELLTPELRKAVDGAETLAALEDIYLPYRPKRRTRAQIARERGLEPLADILWKQDPRDVPQKAAAQFVSPENDVPDTEAALAGARDIVAERISEDAETRKVMRIMFSMRGQLVSSATKTAGEKADEAATFRDYFSWQEPAKAAPGHRILAMMRGEREGMLSLSCALMNPWPCRR